MSRLQDNAARSRFELAFDEPGRQGLVWADYRREGEVLAIPHVEAEPQLRNTGASGLFMQALAEHARAQGLKLRPICGYAVHWLARHPETRDLVVQGR